MNRTRWSLSLRSFGLVTVLVVGALGCSNSSDDAVDTFAPADASAAVDAGAESAGEGPLAVAAASSEAELARRRAEAGDTLKSFTVTVAAPADLAGKITPESGGAFCSGPGTVVDGESFEVSYTAAKDTKMSALTLKTQGSYEGPGSYAAEISFTTDGPVTGTGTVFVYDDEMSGEFELSDPTPITGTWECRFKS
jgi:hypothetical protein